MQNAQINLDAEQQQAIERAAREKAKRNPAQQLASTLVNLRNWQIGKPQLSIGMPVHDEAGFERIRKHFWRCLRHCLLMSLWTRPSRCVCCNM